MRTPERAPGRTRLVAGGKAFILGALLFGVLSQRAGRSDDGAGAARRESDEMASWFITYKRPMAPPGMIEQVVTPDHGCVLIVTGPITGVNLPDNRQIGRFADRISDEEAGALWKAAGAAIAEANATPSPPASRGARFLTFGMGRTGHDVDSLGTIPLSGKFPPAIMLFDDAMLALAKRLMTHPSAVLSGNAGCEPTAITPQEGFVITLKLQNAGSGPIQVHNPLAAATDESLGLQVMLQKDAGEIIPVRMTRGEVSQAPLPGREKDAARKTVRLQPGEELEFVLHLGAHLHLRTGDYRLWVSFTSAADGIPEEEAVQGTLRIPAGTVSVRPKK